MGASHSVARLAPCQPVGATGSRDLRPGQIWMVKEKDVPENDAPCRGGHA
jgi:hypothetical protein